MTKEERFNLENAADTPIIKDLKGLLSVLTISDLKKICDLLFVNGISNVRKKELVNIIYNNLTDECKLTDVIERFIDREYELLNRLMANEGIVQDNNISMETYHFLYVIGMVFLFKRDNKFYISMTDDVYNAVKKIDLKKMRTVIDENTKVYNLVKSMVELYGVISNDNLDYYYSSFYGNGKELEVPYNTLLFCERNDNINIIDTENEKYFVHNILSHDKSEHILDNIISRQKEIKRKPIKLKELLKYSNYDYYENSEAKNKFKKYLKKQNISSDIIEVIVKTISDMYRLGNDFILPSVEMLQDYGVEITEKNAQEILSYLMEIYNNSRIWENNGWTPKEMMANFKGK